MLPWLNKKSGGSISASLEDGKVRDDETKPMHSVAQELIEAIHAKNPAAVADALEAAFALSESMPHEESEVGE